MTGSFDRVSKFILDVDHHARACWWSTSESSEKCPRVMRGKKSVSSDFADSADLIGICAEFVVALRTDVSSSDFSRAINVVACIFLYVARTTSARARRETRLRSRTPSDLRLYECGEDDDVGEVVTGLRIEDAAAGHQLERRVVARSVDELVREVRLLVHALTNDREHEFASVGQGDVHVVAELQLVQVIEDRWSVVVVNVAQDDRRAFLAR